MTKPLKMMCLQVQNSTSSVVEGIRSALAQATAQSLIEISVLQNSTFALIRSMSVAIAKIFADSGLQLAAVKNTTTFLLEDVYGDFQMLAAESDKEQKSIVNATNFLILDINDNTKYSLASAGSRWVVFRLAQPKQYSAKCSWQSVLCCVLLHNVLLI